MPDIDQYFLLSIIQYGPLIALDIYNVLYTIRSEMVSRKKLELKHKCIIQNWTTD